MSQPEALLVERATSVLGFEVADLLELGAIDLEDLRRAVERNERGRGPYAPMQTRNDHSCNECNKPPCIVRVAGLDSAALARVAAILAEEV